MKQSVDVNLILKSMDNTDEGKKAFDSLCSIFSAPIHNLIGSIIGQNNPNVKDLAQDTFKAAWEERKSLKRADWFRAWLFRIAYNTSMSFHRASREIPTENISEISSNSEMLFRAEDNDEIPPFDANEINEFFNLLKQGFGELSHQQKYIWLLRWEGYSDKEIHLIFGISYDVVKKQWSRAEKRLYTFSWNMECHREKDVLCALALRYTISHCGNSYG